MITTLYMIAKAELSRQKKTFTKAYGSHCMLLKIKIVYVVGSYIMSIHSSHYL